MTYLTDGWTWDGTNWSQVSADVSPAGWASGGLYGADMAADPVTRKLLLFGGQAGAGRSGHTWSWNGTQWVDLAPAAHPLARYAGAMAVNPTTGHLNLYGGLASGNVVENDTWDWNGVTWTALAPAVSPPARYNMAFAVSPATNQLVLYGGYGDLVGTELSDTWAWGGATWTQLPILADNRPNADRLQSDGRGPCRERPHHVRRLGQQWRVPVWRHLDTAVIAVTTRPSRRRVDTPPTQHSTTTATSASRRARRGSSSQSGK